MGSRVRWMIGTALFCVLASGLSYLEFLLPINAAVPIPGFKLGLSNAIVLFLLHRDRRQAFAVLLGKTALTALLFGGATSFVFSLCGALLSFFGMLALDFLLAEHITDLSLSCAGGVLHNLGQLCAAIAFMGGKALLPYATPLMLAGLCCGAVIGLFLNTFSERMNGVLAKLRF